MSIIHNALKKVQTNMQTHQPQVSSVVPDPSLKTNARSQNVFLIPLLLGAVVAVTTALWLFLPRVEAKSPIIQPLVRTHAVKPIIPTPSSVPETTQTTQAPSLLIQGVMINNGKSVALINDAIYEVGEEVDGAKILSIEEKTVTVLKDGTEEILKIKR